MSVADHDLSLHDFSARHLRLPALPKDCAIKAYKLTIEKAVSRPVALHPQSSITPQTTGLVGELATKIGLKLAAKESSDVNDEGDDEEDDGDAETDAIVGPTLAPKPKDEKTLLAELIKRGVAIDGQLLNLVEESVASMREIVPHLQGVYGDLSIVGRGETKYGASPTYGKPDYVAFAPSTKKPILIEVKNTPKRDETQDTFQTKFYNTMRDTVGVVVTTERKENERYLLRPKVFGGSDAETLIVYPRQKDFEIVKEKLDLSHQFIQDIWKAKQLGLIGKSPETNCPSKCPHQRLHVDLPESNIEPLKPLPTIYGRGLFEKDADLDWRYMRRYMWRNAADVVNASYQYKGTKVAGQAKSKLAAVLSERFGIQISEAIALVDPEEAEKHFGSWPGPDVIVKEMADDFESWGKILGKKKLKSIATSTAAQASVTYTLPYGSREFIKKSNDAW